MLRPGKLALVPIVFLMYSCSTHNIISENEKKRALNDYHLCVNVAESWLAELDRSDFSHLLSLKSYHEKLTNQKIAEIIQYYNDTFGNVKSRKFIGAHFWSGKKLITWAPGLDERNLAHIRQVRSLDGFYSINPRYFGLLTASQMFTDFKKGMYVILMYKSVPTNKNYAEEKVILWKNEQGNWQIHGYDIADEI